MMRKSRNDDARRILAQMPILEERYECPECKCCSVMVWPIRRVGEIRIWCDENDCNFRVMLR